MKLTLTKVYTTNKDKEGNELKSKKGIPYTRMSIKAQEYGDKWISGFQNKDNKDWKEGDTVEVEIKENGEYLNFETPKKEEVANGQITDILNKLVTVKMMVTEIHEAQKEIIKALKLTVKPTNAMGVDTPDYVEPNFAPEDSNEIDF